MNILQVDSSLLGEASVSRRLTAEVVAEYRAAYPGARVTYRDLAARPVGHLTGEVLSALRPAPDAPPVTDPSIRAEVALTEQLIGEFLAADLIVIGAPMYNFSIPTPLKAWIDRLAQPGRTFRYGEKGPEGLAGGRTAVIVSSRGGALKDTHLETALDHQEAYLATLLQFFGITDIQYVRAEGLALGPDSRDRALASAALSIRQLPGGVPRAA